MILHRVLRLHLLVTRAVMKIFSPLMVPVGSGFGYHRKGLPKVMKSLILGLTILFPFLAIPSYSQSNTTTTLSSTPTTSTPSPSPSPSYWLIVRYGSGSANSLEKIEMQSMEQCELQGAVWRASKRISPGGLTAFECLEGK